MNQLALYGYGVAGIAFFILFLLLYLAKATLLVDKEGHLVTRRGEPLQSGSVESIAALIAGSFAATREMARLLGEQEFGLGAVRIPARPLRLGCVHAEPPTSSEYIEPDCIEPRCVERYPTVADPSSSADGYRT